MSTDLPKAPASAAATAARIALLGAECTGKSTLARQLGEHLPAHVLDERLRRFCDEMRRAPRAHEQRWLLEEQIRLETLALAAAGRAGLRWVVCDSTPLATALYSAVMFGDDSLMASALAHQRGYIATLVPAPDLPWIADGIQRESAAARDSFHHALLDALRANRLAHVEIAGSGSARLREALAALAAVAPPHGERQAGATALSPPRSRPTGL
ncbi:MAG: AAA family ATPase [Burkholderiaceae bacterium]|nr:AAA family ATPase [Burkholderiaceae bacterium]